MSASLVGSEMCIRDSPGFLLGSDSQVARMTVPSDLPDVWAEEQVAWSRFRILLGAGPELETCAPLLVAVRIRLGRASEGG
eukprot:9623361-Alexandrium_andersonii.AAC.1